VTYRDDHEAALARADALAAELEAERAKHDHDGERIAALEAELAKRPVVIEAKPEPEEVVVADEAEPAGAGPVDSPTDPPRPKPWIKWLVVSGGASLVAAGAIVFFVMRHQAKWAEVEDGWDVQHYVDEATREANKRLAGATISKLVAPSVNSNGQAQLRMRRTGSIDIWFASSMDLTQCLHARVGRDSTSLSYANATDCDVVVPGPLHCSISNVLVRAMQDGLPSGVLASVRLRTEYGKRRWEVVPEHGAQRFDDDCP
jgi:hypothetical protein